MSARILADMIKALDVIEKTSSIPIGRLDRPLEIGDVVKDLSGKLHLLTNDHGDDITTESYFYRWDKYSYTIKHAAMYEYNEITHVIPSPLKALDVIENGQEETK